VSRKLIQVIDASDSEWKNHVAVTSRVIEEIQAENTQRVLLFNKADKLSCSERKQIGKEYPDSLFVSAFSMEDMGRLRCKLAEMQSCELVELRLVLNYNECQILAEFREFVNVISENYAEQITVVIRSTKKYIGKLKSKCEDIT